MSRRTPKVAAPVGSEELKYAILAMIVERFAAKFDGNKGSGSRLGSRVCKFSFSKQ